MLSCFRMGDFYEIFADDAELVSPMLELVLTAREKGGGNKALFAGSLIVQRIIGLSLLKLDLRLR